MCQNEWSVFKLRQNIQNCLPSQAFHLGSDKDGETLHHIIYLAFYWDKGWFVEHIWTLNHYAKWNRRSLDYSAIFPFVVWISLLPLVSICFLPIFPQVPQLPQLPRRWPLGPVLDSPWQLRGGLPPLCTLTIVSPARPGFKSMNF